MYDWHYTSETCYFIHIIYLLVNQLGTSIEMIWIKSHCDPFERIESISTRGRRNIIGSLSPGGSPGTYTRY
jgi:hypothetical protein